MHHDVRTAGDENPYVISTMRPKWSARCGCNFDENPCAFLLSLPPQAHTPIPKRSFGPFNFVTGKIGELDIDLGRQASSESTDTPFGLF